VANNLGAASATPLAALSGSHIKAPGFAGGKLLFKDQEYLGDIVEQGGE